MSEPLPSFFLDWAAKNVLYSLAMNPDLDESKMLVVLDSYRQEMNTKVQLSKDLENKTMQNIIVLGNKKSQQSDGIYKEVLTEALRRCVDDLDDLEHVTRTYERQLKVIEVFIDSIKSAVAED